jgi:predicted transcriptional regulator
MFVGEFMAGKRALTPVEWEIMEAVWDIDGPATVRDVLERAYPGGEKAYTTVQTILNTLERKKLLRRKKMGLVNFYSARRTRESIVRAETSSLLSRGFHGSVVGLASTLLSLDRLRADEIKRLKELLREKEKELGEEER